MTDLPSRIQDILEEQQVDSVTAEDGQARILGIATTRDKIMEVVSQAIVATDIISVRQRRDLVQFLRRPDAAPAREDDWRPIEDAPKDGTPYLARYQWLGKSRYMVICRSTRGPWLIADGFSQVVGDGRSAIKFTHFRALPPEPSEALLEGK